MPELPEVHTTVKGLQKVLPGLRITDVWTDLATGSYQSPHLSTSHKDKNFFRQFRKAVTGTRVLSAARRAKNILIHLSNGNTILIHMKMTGHLMVGRYDFNKKKNSWSVSKLEKNEALRDPYNKFIHVVFSLSDGRKLVLSDMRRFAKVTLVPTETNHESIHLSHLGPEPLARTFTSDKFIERLMLRPKREIKIVLLDQSIIAGIGNIYSDEMLWMVGIHPFSIVSKIPRRLLGSLYKAMRIVLKKGIDFGGDSTSDYRDVHGRKGKFQHEHNVYRRARKPCPKPGCKGMISRLRFGALVGGRSAHYCPAHQKLYK